MHAYLACFDISDNYNRNQVGKRLEHYGDRVQRSVFEISVRSTAELERLRDELREFIDPGDDLRFYTLCRACRQKSHDIDGKRIARYPAAVVI